jgi:hypothetical protein
MGEAGVLSGGRMVLAGLLLAPAVPAAAADRPPNIVHVVGDDIGYDDIGPFGARDIPTPSTTTSG